MELVFHPKLGGITFSIPPWLSVSPKCHQSSYYHSLSSTTKSQPPPPPTTPVYRWRGWERDRRWGKVGSEYLKMRKTMIPIWSISGLANSWLLPPPPPLDSLSFFSSLLPLPHLAIAYWMNVWSKQAKHSDPLNAINFLIKICTYKRTQMPIGFDLDIMTKWVYHWYRA